MVFSGGSDPPGLITPKPAHSVLHQTDLGRILHREMEFEPKLSYHREVKLKPMLSLHRVQNGFRFLVVPALPSASAGLSNPSGTLTRFASDLN